MTTGRIVLVVLLAVSLATLIFTLSQLIVSRFPSVSETQPTPFPAVTNSSPQFDSEFEFED